MRAVFAAALCAIAAASGPVVQIGNLSYPVGFAWDSYGRIYAAEKGGRVKIARSWMASSFTQVVLDLTSQVRAYRFHRFGCSDRLNQCLELYAVCVVSRSSADSRLIVG